MQITHLEIPLNVFQEDKDKEVTVTVDLKYWFWQNNIDVESIKKILFEEFVIFIPIEFGGTNFCFAEYYRIGKRSKC